MKNIKNLFLVAILAVCSFVMVGVVKAAPVGFALNAPACTPNEGLLPGDHATCYIVGTSNQTGPANGYVTSMYTTDGLRFVNAYSYPSNDSRVAALVLEATAASASSQGTLTFTDGSSESFTCKYQADLVAEKADWQIEEGDDYRCVVFYSKGDNFYNGVNSAPTSNITQYTGTGSGMMVLGTVEVKIDEDEENTDSCGEFCVSVKEISEKGGYTTFNENFGTFKCSEVHFTAGGPAGVPDTGAFTSYAILAAGALVAIGAIALAKKYNKFYRV